MKSNRHRDRIGKTRLIQRDDGVDRSLDGGRIGIAGDRAVESRIDDEIALRRPARAEVEYDHQENRPKEL